MTHAVVLVGGASNLEQCSSSYSREDRAASARRFRSTRGGVCVVAVPVVTAAMVKFGSSTYG